MTTTDKKQRLCKQHEKVLKIIYHCGKGIMFKKHIERYMESRGTHTIHTSIAITELREAKVVEVIYMHRVAIIKLLKFAVAFIEKKHVEEVTAISVTQTKISRVAFLNELMLRKLPRLDNEENKDKIIDGILNDFIKNTTYFRKDKQTYKLLVQNVREELYKEEATLHEINLLKKSYESSRARLMYREKDVEKVERVVPFNLNSMTSSNVYVARIYSNNNTLVQHIEIIDVNSKMPASQLVDKIEKTYDYMNQFLKSNMKLKFNFYVASAERKEFFDDRGQKIKNALMRRQVQAEYEVINLDLEKTLFRNQKILLSS
ncbi:hypothetical protein NYE71_32810 [Bacillus sp. FSL K6-0273]|nr:MULTISPECIES: hypothetical protein [Bacillus cereus group]MBG9702280.1 hypothetical protein [Bacillus thuringiensis]MDG1651673.1 hypothetical protein [Bacillus pacificus]MEB9535873.1 hypothetical protein [Bacillus cereus]MEB9726208.1 hypothetical protein [Bacillus cereus]